MSLVIIGTVAFDSIETPFASSGRIVGGAATYASLAASYFSEKVKIVAVVGDDFPAEEIEHFHSRGINTEGLQIKNGRKSFFWAGKYREDLNTRDTLTTDLNVLADFDPLIPENYQDCRQLLLGNLTPSVQKTVIDRLRNRPELIVLDTMNFWMDSAWDDLHEVLTHVDVLTINDEEARQLSGEYSLVKAARKILRLGPDTLVIKKGEHGALLFSGDQVFSAPALPLEEVFDPTGAGDVFAGGFTGYLAKTGDYSFENMKTAVIVGTAMASFCVEQFGTERVKSLSSEAIADRIRRLARLSNFSVADF
ncbi:MAG: PfkB family carbohydrate kinase [Solitalea sp.]